MFAWSPGTDPPIDADHFWAELALDPLASDPNVDSFHDTNDWIDMFMSATSSAQPSFSNQQPLNPAGGSCSKSDASHISTAVVHNHPQAPPAQSAPPKDLTKLAKRCSRGTDRRSGPQKLQVERLQQQYAKLLQDHDNLQGANQQLRVETLVLEDIVKAAGEYVTFLRNFRAQEAHGSMVGTPAFTRGSIVIESTSPGAAFCTAILERVGTFHVSQLHSISVTHVIGLVKQVIADASMYLLSPAPELLSDVTERAVELEALMVALNVVNNKANQELEALFCATRESEGSLSERWASVVEALGLTLESKQKIVVAYQHFRKSLARLHRDRRQLVHSLPSAQVQPGEKAVLDQLAQTASSLEVADRLEANLKGEHFLFYFMTRFFFIEVDPLNLLKAIVASYPQFISLLDVCNYIVNNP